MDCQYFLNIIEDSFRNKTIPSNPEIISSILYSGAKWNDQGDISTCLNDESMNFVEMQYTTDSFRLFRGLCLPKQCSANWLNNNKSILTDYSNIFQLPINFNLITFTQYPLENKSITSVSFILITILIIILFLLTISAFVIWLRSRYKQQQQLLQQQQRIDTTRNINYSLESENKEKSEIKQPLILDSNLQNYRENKDDSENQPKLQNSFQKQNKSIWLRIIDCWNIKNNFQRAITFNVNNSDLLAFNFIRAISFLQVILGHEFLIRISYVSNFQDFTIIQKQPFILFIFGCFYSVDAFFFLGGFFIAYVSADQKKLAYFCIRRRLQTIKMFFYAILQRLIRILPTYLFVLVIFWKYTDFLGDSPTWEQYTEFTSYCDNRWWMKALMIDNLFEDGQMCFGWGWYLSNDIQMFIYSLLLIVVYANNKYYGKILIFISFLIFQSISIYSSYANNYLIIHSIETLPDTKFYYKPWNRSPPYFIGLLVGLYYREYAYDKQNSTKSSKLVQASEKIKNSYLKWIIYALGFGIIFFLIFFPHILQINGTNYLSYYFQNFWYGTSRSFYVLGLTLILLPGMCGSRDNIVKVMGNNIFQFIAKLSFSGYLLHYFILTYSLWSFKDSMYLNSENIMMLFFSESVIVQTLAFIFMILIEYPLNNITNIFFNQQKVNTQIIINENPKTELLESNVSSKNTNLMFT